MEAKALFTRLAAYAATRQWRYIYPVWSRRAQGISIGINLHPNHVCNWHCMYCQVSGLQRGPSPLITIETLHDELENCLDWISEQTATHASLQAWVQDIAFAGDGEPTTSPQFAEVMHVVKQVLHLHQPAERPVQVRLITNGSQLQYAHVQHAIECLSGMGGEVWFKLDAGNDAEMRAVNDSHLPLSLHLQRLQRCCALCATWIQTAVISRVCDDGITTTTTPVLDGYIQALKPYQRMVKGILLYGIARPSEQAGAVSLLPVPEKVLEEYARKLRAQGYQVRAFN